MIVALNGAPPREAVHIEGGEASTEEGSEAAARCEGGWVEGSVGTDEVGHGSM